MEALCICLCLLCLCICLFVCLCLCHCHHQMMRFQKIYGLYSYYSALYDVLDHTHHIFSESLLSGDDNDRDKYLQIDKCKDKDKCKVLPRPNVCYFFQKQGVQGFKILYWLSSCDDKDNDSILYISRCEYYSGVNVFQG